MQQIEIGLRHPEGKDCVFLWLYATDGQPYAKYAQALDPNLTISMVFAQLRWDGKFGTVGGKVDPGESLFEALVRETKEEIGYAIPAGAAVIPFSSFERKGWHIHAYRLKVSYAELVAIRNQAHLGEHSSAECAGYNLVHAADYGSNADGLRGLPAFLQNHFSATAKVELEMLMEHIKAEAAAA